MSSLRSKGECIPLSFHQLYLFSCDPVFLFNELFLEGPPFAHFSAFYIDLYLDFKNWYFIICVANI